MSILDKIDVGTITLKLKLGNNVSNIIWYNTYTEKDQVSILITLTTINTNYSSYFDDTVQEWTQFFNK